MAKNWANVVKEKWGEKEEALTGVEEHMPVFGFHVLGGAEGSKERLLLWRTGDVHGIVLGEDGTFTCDDAVCVKNGVIGDVGVLVYGEGRQ